MHIVVAKHDREHDRGVDGREHPRIDVSHGPRVAASRAPLSARDARADSAIATAFEDLAGPPNAQTKPATRAATSTEVPLEL